MRSYADDRALRARQPAADVGLLAWTAVWGLRIPAALSGSGPTAPRQR